jgi:hypothetical protein
MAQQVRIGLDTDTPREGPERLAGVLRSHRGVAFGAQQQVELDRPWAWPGWTSSDSIGVRSPPSARVSCSCSCWEWRSAVTASAGSLNTAWLAVI